ncbi:UNVERIFIED_CONTAM: hypothetical protein ABIC26_000179 [Paenibacillus sp. PvR008]
MKVLWIFTLFTLLMLGTSMAINWLFGVYHPWELISLAFRIMRPSEYIVLAGMLLLLFVTVGKKPIGNALRILFLQWLRFLKVSTSSSASSTQESHQKEQTGENVNK